MPRDKRLYITLPIDIHRHPKVERLSAEVRWTFVEMNCEARIQDNDGRFAAEDAEFLWPKAHLEALVASHPARPLVTLADGVYAIRDYAEHQLTRQAREDLKAKRTAAGRAGGKAKAEAASKPLASASTPLASASPLPSTGLATPSNSYQSQSQSQSQSDPTVVSEVSHVSIARERKDDGEIEVTDEVRLAAFDLGITDIIEPARALRALTGEPIPAGAALEYSRHVLERSAQGTKFPGKYVLAAIERSPVEARNFLDYIDWQAMSPSAGWAERALAAGGS